MKSTKKLVLSDDNVGYNLKSTWKLSQQKGSSESCSQTDSSFCEYQDAVVQTGIATEIIQDEFSKKDEGLSLIKKLTLSVGNTTNQSLQASISDGFVLVDDQVITDSSKVFSPGSILEYSNIEVNAMTQTDPLNTRTAAYNIDDLSVFLRRASVLVEDAIRENIELSSSIQTITNTISSTDRSTVTSIRHLLNVDIDKYKVVYPDWSISDYYTGRVIQVTIARNLDRVYNIELEDGTSLSHVREENIHLIVRESSSSSSSSSNSDESNMRNNNNEKKDIKYQPGLRVYFKINIRQKKTSNTSNITTNTHIYYPGQIIECTSSGSYNIEYDGNCISKNVPYNDIRVGLNVGDMIESKKPMYTQLICTNITMNSTGNMVAVSYGTDNYDTWCTDPGLILLWNIWSSSTVSAVSSSTSTTGTLSLNSDNNNKKTIEPSIVLDYHTCISNVCYHPLLPNILASSTQNGEIVIWNVNMKNTPLLSSIINMYSHSGPVTCLKWIPNTYKATTQQMNEKTRDIEYDDRVILNDTSNDSLVVLKSWLLLSGGNDGKILIWHVSNEMKYPLCGITITIDTPIHSYLTASSISTTSSSSSSTSMSTTKKKKLRCTGIRCMDIITSSTTSGSNTGSISVGSSISSGIMMLGLENGCISRVVLNEVMSKIPILTKESIKKEIPPEEIYVECKDSHKYETHVGPVNSIALSPFQRNVYMTGGDDGAVRIYDALEKYPILQWIPTPSNTLQGISSVVCPITCVTFSPHRACVFAVSSYEGFIYIYDLSINITESIEIIDTLTSTYIYEKQVIQDNTNTNIGSGIESSVTMSVSSTAMSPSEVNTLLKTKSRLNIQKIQFHNTRKDYIIGTDVEGKVYVWKLNSTLTTIKKEDTTVFMNLISN